MKVSPKPLAEGIEQVRVGCAFVLLVNNCALRVLCTIFVAT